MEPALLSFAERHHIPFITQFPEEPGVCSADLLRHLISNIVRRCGDSLIMYGGQTATPDFYGYRQMRSVTTDIDFVCTQTGVIKILHNFKLEYHRSYDVFYLYQDHVPVTFSYRHIHDWIIDDTFIETSRYVFVDGQAVRCCSATYSILLKLFRTVEYMRKGRRMFGKDAIDIINMLMAPYFRTDLPLVRLSLIANICVRSFKLTNEEVDFVIHSIEGYQRHLPTGDRKLLASLLGEMKLVFETALEKHSSKHWDDEP